MAQSTWQQSLAQYTPSPGLAYCCCYSLQLCKLTTTAEAAAAAAAAAAIVAAELNA